MIEKEVIIIGGGPAGAACAGRLRQHEIDCLILDKSKFPRSKPCAGWLTPSVFDLLQIQPDQYPHSLTQFKSFKISIRGFKFRLPTHQYTIRRLEFDDWMLQRAGVEVRHHHAREIENSPSGFCIDHRYTSKYLVGAGGTHCPVRQTLFKRDPSAQTNGLIVAKEEEFSYPILVKDTHLWFFENGLPGYAWYVPKSDGFVNFGIGASAAGLKKKGKTLNQYWDELVIKLADSGMVENHQYKPSGHSYYLRQAGEKMRRGNAFLVGDALGLATRDMGEGIGPAIQSGLLAADSIIHNRDYELKSIHRFSFPALLGLRK